VRRTHYLWQQQWLQQHTPAFSIVCYVKYVIYGVLLMPLFCSFVLLRQPGDVIIHQGERGDHFYIVEAGTFCVLVATNPSDLQHEDLQRYQVEATSFSSTIARGSSLGGSSAHHQPSLLTTESHPLHVRTTSNILLDNDTMAGERHHSCAEL
jgi:hypothetical protein